MDHNASASIFGWQFQINSAILYFINHIKEIKSIRIEGKDEDIEISLLNGKKILIQAKSSSKLGIDKSAIKKLRQGINTLYLGSQNNEVEKLIYTTNYPNPIGGSISHYDIFMGSDYIERPYNEIPSSYKKNLVKILNDISEEHGGQFNTDILNISVIHFDGSHQETRFRTILRMIREFLIKISVNQDFSKSLLEIWQSDFLFNATNSDISINLNKNQIIWPIIVLNSQLSEEDKTFQNLIEKFEMDEEGIGLVLHQYSNFINKQTEKFSFVMKVNNEYEIYKKNKIGVARQTISFINNNWTDYLYLVDLDTIEEEVKEVLVKIILSKILNQKQMIKKIKQEVNLEI